MLESFSVAVIAGLVLGYLAGLGIGGGSLLILWLTLVLQFESVTARAINLMFFIAAASAVSFFRWKKGTLDLKKILPGIICGSISAGLFSLLSISFDTGKLKVLFGLLLLITGVRELFYRTKEFR